MQLLWVGERGGDRGRDQLARVESKCPWSPAYGEGCSLERCDASVRRSVGFDGAIWLDVDERGQNHGIRRSCGPHPHQEVRLELIVIVHESEVLARSCFYPHVAGSARSWGLTEHVVDGCASRASEGLYHVLGTILRAVL